MLLANGKIIFTYLPYTDINIWVIFFFLSVVLFIASRVITKTKLPFGGIALLLSIPVGIGSLSIAYIDKILVNETFNATTGLTTYMYEPSVQVVTSTWLAAFTLIWFAINFINVIWIMADMLVPSISELDNTIKEENEGEL